MMLAALLLAAAQPAPTPPQAPPARAAAPAPNMDAVQIRVERLAPGVAALFGRGGNIGLSYGADGNVIIDDQYAPLTDRILAAIRTLDPAPIRFVVNTHWHGDHTGGNENVGRTGAVIVAQDNVRRRMSMEQMVMFRQDAFQDQDSEEHRHRPAHSPSPVVRRRTAPSRPQS